MDERTDRPTYVNHAGEDMSCEQFQDRMPGLVAGDEDIHLHVHLKTCQRCSALLEELEAIAIWAKQMIKPDLEPPPGIWENIQKQMSGPESLQKPDQAGSHSFINDGNPPVFDPAG